MNLTVMVVLVISLALFFDFTNGFHDTANAMATPIATGAIKPKIAVALAAVLNLVGAFLSTEVARTISGGLIREGSGGIRITPEIIFAGLLGAIIWNLLTWLLGLPSSSSHLEVKSVVRVVWYLSYQHGYAVRPIATGPGVPGIPRQR